jgi:hypothetical protein
MLGENYMDEDNSPVQDNTSVNEDVVAGPEADAIAGVLDDTEDESEAPVAKEAVEETSEPAEDAESETPTEVENQPEESEDLQPEDDPKEEARRRYEERQRVIAERRERVQSQTQDYVQQGEDEYDQRLRSMEVEQYTAKIENTENSLVTEFERVKANPDLQIFNPDNKDQFNEKAYDKALRDYNAGYVNYDTNGNMVGLKGSLFEHLTETAELLSGAVKNGQVQQVRATRKMRSNADTKPAAQPKESTKDPILEALLSD